MSQPAINAQPHGGTKCPRCWHSHHVADNCDGLCDRCSAVIVQHFPDHESAPKIRDSLQQQRKKYCVRPESAPCPHLHCCRHEALLKELA